ncbi:hypothetical protein NDU88_002136 [Pleurodeles waltl]|uniref:Uncharacterized protein n=1 Tax=Pleurodeles waltl TaxID=8319 RepID=A0AAV7TJZ0_PLEWA|nr:hypothetical protein NDU88_002136 [Pleurodeles waltl]
MAGSGTSRSGTGHSAAPLSVTVTPIGGRETATWAGPCWCLQSGPAGLLGIGRRLRGRRSQALGRVYQEASTLREWRRSHWVSSYKDWAPVLQSGACGEQSLQVGAPAGPTGDIWLGPSRGKKLVNGQRLLSCCPGYFF